MQELKGRLEDDRDLIDEILRIYADESPAAIKALEQALSGGDPETVSAAAHTLKGMSANASAEAVRRLAYRLEAAARTGDLGEARGLMDGIRSALGRTLKEIEKILAECKS
jgi:two-component system sensor histidine kinase BarA